MRAHASRCRTAWKLPIGFPNCTRAAGVLEREVERAFGCADDLVRGRDAAEERAAAARFLGALLGEERLRILRVERDLVHGQPPCDRHRLEVDVFERDDRRTRAGPVEEDVLDGRLAWQHPAHLRGAAEVRGIASAVAPGANPAPAA